ncbi:MAG: dethiobiotin synthase [Pontiella sp.]
MKGIFVTGTDTDIGKTVLSALLLAELRRRKTDAAPMKPMQTGCEGGVPDLDYSLAMAQMTVSDEDYANMSPYRFEPACSPHLAAEMAGTEIELAEIVIAARTLASEYEFVIAEGAGGIMVPLNRKETALDLMQALKLPIVIIARPGLGTINHTLLSIRTLRADGLNIAGVVFVTTTPEAPSFIEKDNTFTIEQFGKVPILGTIPYCSQLAEPNPNYAGLPISVVAEVEKIVNKLAI